LFISEIGTEGCFLAKLVQKELKFYRIQARLLYHSKEVFQQLNRGMKEYSEHLGALIEVLSSRSRDFKKEQLFLRRLLCQTYLTLQECNLNIFNIFDLFYLFHLFHL